MSKVVWNVAFKFRKPIEENYARGLNDIEFLSEERDGKIILAGFSVNTPPLSKNDAKSFAKQKANRILDYMSAIHGIPIECNLNSIGPLKPPGEVSTRETYMTADATILSPMSVDFVALKHILDGKNRKLMRQLSHYRRGIEAKDDIVTQIREFYMVIEDDNDTSFITQYSYIRHFVRDVEIDTSSNAKKKVNGSYGQSYIVPTDHNILKKLKRDLPLIRTKAETIIGDNIKAVI